MGLFDIFKNKSDQTQQQPAQQPAQQPSAAPQQAAPAPTPSAPSDPIFQVKFGEKIPYYDPEIVMIEIGYSGVAEVRCEGRTGEDNDIQYVRRQILIFMEEELRKIADEEKVLVADLNTHISELSRRVADRLKNNKIKTESFSIITLGLTDKGKGVYEVYERKKKMDAMTPEELSAMMQEQTRKAQEMYDKLSPEEKARIEREVKEKAEQMAREREEILAQARAISEGTISDLKDLKKEAATPKAGEEEQLASAMAAAIAYAAMPETKAEDVGFETPQNTAEQPKRPKFCPSCGTPVTGGKFCTNCGAPF